MSDQKDSPYESSYLSSFGLALGMAIGQDDVLRAWESRWAESENEPKVKARLFALLGGHPPLKPLEIAQRTPATFSSYAGSHRDYVFGDALVAVRDRGFIVEYKRSLGGWVKEVDPKVKPHKVRVLQRVSKHRPDEEGNWVENEDADMEMYNISRAAHWFAYGKKRRAAKNGLGMSVDLCFAPYVTLPLGPAGIQNETELLAPFLSALVGGARGVELRILSEYLTCMQDAALGDDKKGGSASPVEAIKANGIFVYFDTEGRCRMFRFRSIQELREKLENLSLVNPPAENPVQTGKPAMPEPRAHTRLKQSPGKKLKGP
jgi:hypothetical protein